MIALEQQIETFLNQLGNQHSKIWLAYSGGMDSRVLLQLLAEAQSRYSHLHLSAIHVNHQLQTDALAWEAHCQQQCEQLGIALMICRVDATPKDRQSPEQAAREARYDAFAEHLSEDDILVTAHHANDQAETLLLQLMRGAGTAGLSAMPMSRSFKGMNLYRPLLGFSRQMLQDFANHKNLQWVEDPSNQETDIRRNFIRHEVMPVLDKQWPEPEKSINQSARHLADTEQTLNWFLECELAKVLLARDVLAIDTLLTYPTAIQRHLLRRWYVQLGLAAPGEDKLALIMSEVMAAKADANPELKWQGSVLHRCRNRLLLSPDWEPIEHQHWSAEATITTSAWQLNIAGLNSINTQELTASIASHDMEINQSNRLRSLKKVFKDKAVPVRFRSLLPAVFMGSELIYVSGIFQHPDYAALTFHFDFKRLGDSVSDSDQPLLSVLDIA